MTQNPDLRIIVIDDNPAIHQDFMKILLANKGGAADTKMAELEKGIFGEDKAGSLLPKFTIDTATQGREGVEKIAQAIKDGNPYALAFVDVRMPPGWDGVETIKHIWELDPSIQVVICTAYSDYTWEETVEELGQHDNLLILKKPFDNIAVRQLACALTKKWQLGQEAKDYTSSLETRVQDRTESLKKSLSLMRATLESSADGVLVIDNEGLVSDSNTKFMEMWRIPLAILDTKNFGLITEYIADQLDNNDDYLFQVRKLTLRPEDVLIGTLKCQDKRVFEYYTQPYLLNDKIQGRVWSYRDITKRATLEEELHYQATHDMLTGLPNRVLLLDRIRQAMAKADRNNTMFGVLFMDLDRFKLINDSLSHEAGDEILRAVAKRFQSAIREEDTLVRLGGDEFVVIFCDIREADALGPLAQKLLDTFEDPFKIYQHEVTLSTSIGICVYPRDGRNIDVLLRNADTAMYHSKELGANQYQFYTEELNRKNLLRLENESELRHAIARDEFFLFYQPQVDLTTEKLVSVEALIRWNHPTRGLVLPIDFIPLAEETGLIVPIGEWVLRTACKQLKDWQDQGLPPIRVAVNITTRQFRLYNLTQTIMEILEETKLEPKYLELELTENMIISNIDVVKTIHDIKKLGVQIVLDDFGTGYSSLNYLREIPVDRLKIDQSYVQNIESNRGDDVIIQAIIAMANSLNLEVLAEGVETESQLSFLRTQKCGEVQGFYYSKPISALECEKLLKTAEPFKISDPI